MRIRIVVAAGLLLAACSPNTSTAPVSTTVAPAPATTIASSTTTLIEATITTTAPSTTTTTTEPAPATTAGPEAVAFVEPLAGWLPESTSATLVYELGLQICASAGDVVLEEGEFLEDVLADAVVGDALGDLGAARGPALRLTAAAVELLCPEHADGLRFPLSTWTDAGSGQAIDVGVCVYDEGGAGIVVECDDTASGLVMTMFEEDGPAPWPFGPGAEDEYELALAACRSLFEPTGGWGAVPVGTEQDWIAGDQRIACWAEIVTTVTVN